MSSSRHNLQTTPRKLEDSRLGQSRCRRGKTVFRGGQENSLKLSRDPEPIRCSDYRPNLRAGQVEYSCPQKELE